MHTSSIILIAAASLLFRSALGRSNPLSIIERTRLQFPLRQHHRLSEYRLQLPLLLGSHFRLHTKTGTPETARATPLAAPSSTPGGIAAFALAKTAGASPGPILSGVVRMFVVFFLPFLFEFTSSLFVD